MEALVQLPDCSSEAFSTMFAWLANSALKEHLSSLLGSCYSAAHVSNKTRLLEVATLVVYEEQMQDNAEAPSPVLLCQVENQVSIRRNLPNISLVFIAFQCRCSYHNH